MQVKDIMTKKVFSVKSSTSVAEVARLLVKGGFHGVPVVGDDNKLVGIITESDFFVKDIPNLYLPSYIELLGKTGFAKKLSGSQHRQVERLLEAKACDIMTKKCLAVPPSLEFKKLVKLFKEKHLYTLPVIDQRKKVVGIVTLYDIIKLV